MTRLTPLFVLALCATGCPTSVGPNPEDVPDRQELAPGIKPVLEITLEATEGGYRVLDSARRMGSPTLAIIQSRDVLIRAYDSSGSVIESVSVANPRQTRAAGTGGSGNLILPRGTVTVRLPAPERIASVEVVVRRGPNENYRQMLRVRSGPP